VFTKNQRELIGRNGVEAFLEIFRRDARLAVILFRAGYGETEYTDLEVRGIQDRGMETRWQSPILINGSLLTSEIEIETVAGPDALDERGESRRRGRRRPRLPAAREPSPRGEPCPHAAQCDWPVNDAAGWMASDARSRVAGFPPEPAS